MYIHILYRFQIYNVVLCTRVNLCREHWKSAAVTVGYWWWKEEDVCDIFNSSKSSVCIFYLSLSICKKNRCKKTIVQENFPLLKQCPLIQTANYVPVLVQSKTLRIMSFEAKSKRWDRDELRAIVIFRTPASSFPVNELEYGRISKNNCI